MKLEVTMPQLGETVAEGTVTRWLRKVGDEVGDQEPLLEISTDKVDTEVPAPAAGRLLEIVVQEDTTVPVGAVLAVLELTASSHTSGAPPSERPPRHVHSPRVRRLASESGVSLATLVGSGPHGRVTPDDVQRAARFAESEVSTKEANPPAQVPRAVPFAGHFSQQLTVVEVDVTAVTALGARFASRFAAASVPSTLTAFLALAAFEALRARPLVSGTAKQQLALVVDTDRGPVTAVLSNAGDLNLLGLSRRISEVAARAHEGSLSVDELGVATLTLADSGSRGVLFDSPVLRDGQPLSLGSGSVVERAVVARGSDGAPVIAIRSMVYLALSHDPSVVDQAGAAGFLAAIKSRLELANFDNEFG